MPEEYDLIETAKLLGRSPAAVYRMLAKHPLIEAGIRRRGGRRILSRSNVNALRRAFEVREESRRATAAAGN